MAFPHQSWPFATRKIMASSG